MKNSLLALLILPVLIGATYTPPTPTGNKPEIRWHDFNTGFELAKKEGKIAVIDCYTDWCGWCKVMDQKTFSDDSIITRFNENYVAIKFNPEKQGTYFIGSGDSLSGRQLLLALSNNKPGGYPTFFFFVPESNKIFQIAGYQDVGQFNETLDNIERYRKTVAK